MTELSNTSSPLPKRKPGIFIQFLGSMNLAVTLLVMLAIASVIGTVLQQNQVFQDYIIKFGPFWTQVFNELGLFHVYGAAWFILVLLFLLISTSVCVSRNGPTFLKEIKQYSEKLSLNAYKHQPHSLTYTPESFDTETAQAILKQQGYKTKIHQREDGVTVAGLKGRWNRLGYIFTHISIIVICIGALFDSNLLLKYRELTGNLAPETRSVSLDKIPQKSWLGPENFSFRGSVNIAEGQKSDVLFLPYERGFLVQKLPFTIDVKDFRIEYYDTGMPKSFESDIVLSAPDLDKPIEKTIAVNHPLFYKNYAIYQSSFGDGGSLMKLKVHPLLSPTNNPLTLNTAVDKVEPLKTPMGTYRLELNDFKMFNIVPASDEEKAKTGKKMHNNGPTIIFKVRNEQGKAWEYENYMQPSLQDGRWFFMTGMRTSQAEPFRYLFIPADAQRQKTRFFNFLALINNKNKAQEVLQDAFPKANNIDDRTYQLQMRLLNQLMVLFRQKGFSGISQFVQKNVPEKDRSKVKDYYMGQTSLALQTLYLEILKQEKVKELDDISDFNKQWFEDALTVINSLPNYGPPMYFELDSFKQIESTGLQITKSPGKDIVYFGSALLIIGVFFLFYVRQKRIWLAYSEKEGTLTIAGKDNKELPEVAKEFQQIVQAVQSKMQVKS
ncbi:Cytochrome c biogenesis protein CcsB [Hydrogenovibrio crunogenus]|uniref:Cytochrome c biogenesis protein CcsB n=1 Tax=Hydrogenovibrio crunogenus TaxID=39765 RepID=A0A4P7NWW8_9GAMM|nr:cytochrome c biogenesis protein ResB [Hydrogenovibrio crunogenus]QBZ82018.1 Cytochrome c biogenesis protein CcsB [Hydrogenovibrio crunogenus]